MSASIVAYTENISHSPRCRLMNLFPLRRSFSSPSLTSSSTKTKAYFPNCNCAPKSLCIKDSPAPAQQIKRKSGLTHLEEVKKGEEIRKKSLDAEMRGDMEEMMELELELAKLAC